MLIDYKQLLTHRGFIRYFKNTSWMIGEQFLRIIAGLFVGIWVARYLGPVQFGLFSYVLAFTAIFGGVANIGLDGIVVRELVNHPLMRNTYLGTAFWLKFFGAIVVIALIAIVLPFTANDATTKLFIFIIATGFVFQSFQVIEFYFQSQVLAKIVSICKVAQLILSSLIRIFLVLIESELIWFVVVTLFDALSLAISYVITYRLRNIPNFYRYFNLSIAKGLTKDSWPLVFSAVFAMIYLRIDQIMIRGMLGEYEVGIYSAAIKLSEAFYFIPVLLSTSLFPAIINGKKIAEQLYLKRLQYLYTLMVWLAISIALPLSFLSDWLIVILFGHEYQAAGQVLMIHVWASIFIFLSAVFGRYLIVENLAILNFYRVFIGAVLNILLNYVLIPKYGISGSAVATLISLFIVNIIFDIFNQQLTVQLKMKLRAFYMPFQFLVHFIKKVGFGLYKEKN